MKSVYVGNLPYATTDSELKALFEPFGTVYSARIKTDRDTGRPLGYGFVQMEDAAAAQAIQALDGKEHAGRNLRVNESREKTPSGDRPPRREGGFDRGNRPPRREGGFDRGNRPPRRDFGSSDRPQHREGGFDRGNRPPRRDFNPARHTPERPVNRDFNPVSSPDPADDFDNDADDVSDYSSSHEYGNDRPQRRRTFRKNNQYGNRDNRDSDRPRRPFVKSSPRKKGYRPNEDYESEE